MSEITNKLKQHYEATFRENGPTPQGVDWGTDASRLALRYEKMLAVISQNSARAPSLLDVGCGFGGLLDYARLKGLELDYTGIDVAENMIQWACDTCPDAKFILGDIFEYEFDQCFDYVVCNGILTQKLDVSGSVMDQFAARLIKQMYELCNMGIAFNVMTTKVNFFSNNLYYRNPAELFAWCFSEITPFIRLDHAYPLYEYTLCLYREPVGNEGNQTCLAGGRK